jgi:hypothetical protein
VKSIAFGSESIKVKYDYTKKLTNLEKIFHEYGSTSDMIFHRAYYALWLSFQTFVYTNLPIFAQYD